ncbi:YqjF family protein [Subtercola sp. YIM 133946]|uniref:YqjF family protein n=1 Tax=Subtercola sp. YIM 133946 TaxID=3118909 RepID=UPI002F927546
MSSPPHTVDRPILSQQWRNLTFLHWRIPTDDAASLMPPGVTPDEFDGSSWVGLVPFTLRDTRFGRSPALPFFGTFHETNVRLYARDADGRRGVVFLSLEAERLAAVAGANAAFGLPYVWSQMRVRRSGGTITYTSRRHSTPRGQVDSAVSVRPGAPIGHPDALADFLTARWALFSRHLGRTLYLPNTHQPWSLQHAELLDFSDTLLTRAGLPAVANRMPDSVLFAPGVDARFGPPQRLEVAPGRASR